MERRKFRFKTPEELGDSYYSFFPKYIYIHFDSLSDMDTYDDRTTGLISRLPWNYIEHLIDLNDIFYSDDYKFPIVINKSITNQGSNWHVHESAIVWDYSKEELATDIQEGKYKNIIKLFNMMEDEEI